MKLHTIIAAAATTLALTASACFVPQIILESLPGEFTLVTRAPSTPALDKQTITIIPPPRYGSGGTYRAVLSVGKVLNMTFTDTKLAINHRAQTAFLEVPRKTTYRRMSFVKKPKNPLKLYGRYACYSSQEGGGMYTQLYPVGDDSQGSLTFCAAKDAFGGNEWVVAVKKADDTSNKDCVPFVAVVSNGLRPL